MKKKMYQIIVCCLLNGLVWASDPTEFDPSSKRVIGLTVDTFHFAQIRSALQPLFRRNEINILAKAKDDIIFQDKKESYVIKTGVVFLMRLRLGSAINTLSESDLIPSPHNAIAYEDDSSNKPFKDILYAFVQSKDINQELQNDVEIPDDTNFDGCLALFETERKKK